MNNMNCKDCPFLYWHPNKGFYCTVPRCNPNTSIDDVRDIHIRAGLVFDKPQIEIALKKESDKQW